MSSPGKAAQKSASKSSKKSNTSAGKKTSADLASSAVPAEVNKLAATTLLPPLGNLTVSDLYCLENPKKLLPFIPPVQIIGFDESFEPKPVGISIKPELLISPTASPRDYNYRSPSISQRADAGGSGLVAMSTEVTAPEPAAGILTAAETEFINSLLKQYEPGCTEFVGHEIKGSKCTEFDRYFFDNCSPREKSALQQPQTYSPQDTLYGRRSVAKEYKTTLFDINSKIDDAGFTFTLPDVPEPKLVLTKSDHKLLDPSCGGSARTATIADTVGFVPADVTSAQIAQKAEFIYSGTQTIDTELPAPLPPMTNNLCLDTFEYPSRRGKVVVADGSAPDKSAPVESAPDESAPVEPAPDESAPGGPAPPPEVSEEPVDDMCPGFGTKITGQHPEACIDCTEPEKTLFAGYNYTLDHFQELREAYHYFAAPDEMLHVSNFARSLRAIGQNPSKKDIRKMLVIASVRPEDGRITLENYLKAVACWGMKSHASMIEDLVESLKAFGPKCDEEPQEPDFQNLRYALMNYGEPLKEEDVQQLMQYVKSEIPDEKDSLDNITKRLISQYRPNAPKPEANTTPVSPVTPS